MTCKGLNDGFCGQEVPGLGAVVFTEALSDIGGEHGGIFEGFTDGEGAGI